MTTYRQVDITIDWAVDEPHCDPSTCVCGVRLKNGSLFRVIPHWMRPQINTETEWRKREWLIVLFMKWEMAKDKLRQFFTRCYFCHCDR